MVAYVSGTCRCKRKLYRSEVEKSCPVGAAPMSTLWSPSAWTLRRLVDGARPRVEAPPAVEGSA